MNERQRTLEVLDRIAREGMDEHNNQHLDDFEGLSPIQMHGLIHFPFDGDRSPMVLDENVDPSLLETSKLYRDIRTFLSMVREAGPIKMTAHGNLNTRSVKALVEKGVLEDDAIFFGKDWPRKVCREKDSYYIHMMNLVTHRSGLTRKAGGKMHMTKKGQALVLGPSIELYMFMLRYYTTGFNWGFFDLYPDSWIIQGGFGFQLYLLLRHGSQARETGFYSDRFVRAFPKVLDDFRDDPPQTARDRFENCFHTRFIDRFCVRFGLATVSGKGYSNEGPVMVSGTPLLSALVCFKDRT